MHLGRNLDLRRIALQIGHLIHDGRVSGDLVGLCLKARRCWSVAVAQLVIHGVLDRKLARVGLRI